jgi:two-component system sensor histidine kinase/response regulator
MEEQNGGELESLRKTIAEIDKEKQQIISIVSHDIKAPLNRIFALVQLLHMSEENLTDEQQQYLDKIHQVVADGLSMIRNLVDYRNLEYRKIDINPEEIDVKDFMTTTVKNFKSLAGKKNITIHLDAPESAVITTDNQCLNRVADSLLSNAIKFSNDGKEIFVSVKTGTDNVEISVRDQARGFTGNDLLNLYNKFQKLSAKPTSGESSTGLGLYITKKMLTKIGGSITCKTEEGIGSTFVIVLPKKFEFAD